MNTTRDDKNNNRNSSMTYLILQGPCCCKYVMYSAIIPNRLNPYAKRHYKYTKEVEARYRIQTTTIRLPNQYCTKFVYPK